MGSPGTGFLLYWMYVSVNLMLKMNVVLPGAKTKTKEHAKQSIEKLKGHPEIYLLNTKESSNRRVSWKIRPN